MTKLQFLFTTALGYGISMFIPCPPLPTLVKIIFVIVCVLGLLASQESRGE